VPLAKKEYVERIYKAAQPQWQPIETAPKDGMEVLMYFKGRGFEVSHYCGYWTDYERGSDTPLYWMPLPQSPKVNTKKRHAPNLQKNYRMIAADCHLKPCQALAENRHIKGL